MADMIEKAARALCEANAEPGWTGCVYPNCDCASGAYNGVLAVVEALRDPSDEMLSVLGGECLKWAPGAWREMIDEILRGEHGEG